MGPPVTSDFNLDTDGHCFFCLKKILRKLEQRPELVETPKRVGGSKNCSVYYLARYLKMDMRKVFNDKGQIPSNLLAQVRRSRLKVELCEKCTSLNKSFAGLCQQLDKLEIEINSSLNLIHEQFLVADRSDKHGSRHLTECHLNSTMSNGLSKIVDVLREEAIQKCSKKLRVLSPRVKIENLPKNQINEALYKHPSSSGITKKWESSEPELVGIIKTELESPNENVLSDDDNRNYDDDMDSESIDEEHATMTDGLRASINGKKFSSKNSSVAVSTASTVGVKDGKYKKQKIRYRCTVCGKDFSRRSDYNRHHKIVHAGERFQCKVCNQLFTQKGHLYVHQRMKRCRVRRTETEFEFSHENLLSNHDTVDGIKDYEDYVNTDVTRAKANDDMGTEVGVNRTSRSGIKTTTTTNIATRKVVKLKHTRNPETGGWKCNVCPMEFTSNSGIASHYRSVHQKIRYKCALCEKQFVHRSDYNRHHKSVHVGVRFQCKVCNKVFSQKNNLTVHQRRSRCKKETG